MSILDFIPGFRRKSASLASPSPDLMEILGAMQPSASGVSVTAATAMQVPAVQSAVRAIAEACAQLEVGVYRREGDARLPAREHPAHDLISEDANDWTTAYNLKLAVTLDALTNDFGGVALVNRVNGVPREILHVPPEAISFEIGDFDEVTYRVVDSHGSRIVPRSDVIHIRPLGPLSKTRPNRSPMSLCREAIGLSLVMEQYAARMFGNGAMPSGVLSIGSPVGPDAIKRLRDAWQLAHGGGKTGGTAVLDAATTYTPLSLTSVDAQFIELRTFQIQEIGRAFRVPPHMLFELHRATWANISDMAREFIEYTMMPWLELWEGELRRALFTPEERKIYCVEFDYHNLTKTDIQTRASAYSSMISSRIVSPNEVRAWEDLPPYDGGNEFFNPAITPGTSPATTDPAAAEGVDE